MNELFIAINGKPVRIKDLNDLNNVINEHVEIDMKEVVRFVVNNINDFRREVE